MFSDPRSQLGALSPGQVCDDGVIFVTNTLQNMLVKRRNICSLNQEVNACKVKSSVVVTSRTRYEECLRETERSLAVKEAHMQVLNEKSAFLFETLKSVEMRTIHRAWA